MALLDIQTVTKKFGGLSALRNVDLKLEKEEIVGLIGPNGSGKTTLINVIAGFYKPDTGKVFFDGHEITGLYPHEIAYRGIVRTFQLTRPFGNLSVLENVTIGALLKKRTVEEAEREALEILRSIELYEMRNSRSKDLTTGNRKRLELARALAVGPRILLLDEVLAGLTTSEAQSILSLLDKLRREHGVSFLIVEHIVRAIMTISDRIAVLDAGEKIAEGKPDSVAADETVRAIYLGKELV